MRDRSMIGTLLGSALLAVACGPGVRMPPVLEPLDSQEWQRCAGELEDREAKGLLDDLTLDSKTLVCRGVVLAQEGKTDAALEALIEAGVRDDADHRPHYLAGRILAEAGRYEEALTEYERSQRRYPEMEVPGERLGRSIEEKDGAPEAIRFLEKADGRQLCNYGCLGLLADLHRRSDNVERAEQIYERMIDVEPAEPAAYVGLAAIRNNKQRWADEAEQLERAVKAERFAELGEGGRAEILYSLAFARYNGQRYDSAAEAIDQALALLDERADWRVLAGWIELKRDHPKAALDHFEQARRKDPDLAAAHTGKGDSLSALLDHAGASKSYRTARQHDDKSAVIALKLARSVALEGDKARARELFDEAVALDEKHLPAELVREVSELIGPPPAESKD